jgi:hypothetical protein
MNIQEPVTSPSSNILKSWDYINEFPNRARIGARVTLRRITAWKRATVKLSITTLLSVAITCLALGTGYTANIAFTWGFFRFLGIGLQGEVEDNFSISNFYLSFSSAATAITSNAYNNNLSNADMNRLLFPSSSTVLGNSSQIHRITFLKLIPLTLIS